jgi:DNA-binding MarR family transcriptional regulator
MEANHDQHERRCASEWASLVQLLTVGSRKLRRVFGQWAATLDLSETQFLFLFACGRVDGGLCQSDLAEQTGLSAAQASGLVDQLERRGLLEVGRSVTDRRRRLCLPSDLGRAHLDQILTQVAPVARELRDQIGQPAQDQLRQALHSLLDFNDWPSKRTKSDTLNSDPLNSDLNSDSTRTTRTDHKNRHPESRVPTGSVT